MKSFTLEEITQITGGMLTRAEDVKITHIAPPLLSDENTLALALGEEEIANLKDENLKLKRKMLQLLELVKRNNQQ